jgi:hypothetical protein
MMTITLSADDIKRCREISQGANGLIMDIIEAVAEASEIPVKAILSDGKSRPIVEARWLISYIAHVEQGHSLPKIARVLKYKDHTGVHYGVVQELKRRGLQTVDEARKLNGPQRVVEHPRGPNHGDLSEEIAHMADNQQYMDSCRFGKLEQGGAA